jgi:alkylation response protein AidB-like acyl-CoA dehydrogenase
VSFDFPGDDLFNEDEEDFRTQFREWLWAHPPPPAPVRVDRSYLTIYRAWQAELAAAGYGALHWPIEYGGADRPVGHQIVQLEELARSNVDHTIFVNAFHMVGPLLMAAGDDAQRNSHLPRILRGEELWSLLLSEPDAGSDLASAKTIGRVDGEHLVINGQKVWTSWGHLADWGLLLCRTQPGTSNHDGLSLVMLKLNTPGIEVRSIRQMNGDAEFNEVFFKDAHASTRDVIGGIGNGWTTARTLLGAERTGLALTYYTSMIADLHKLLLRLKGTSNPELREELARVYTGVAIQRLTAFRACSAMRLGSPSLAVASVGKLQTGNNRRTLASLRIASLGAFAMLNPQDQSPHSEDMDVYLFSPSATIAGGTSEMQRNALAEGSLHLPREKRRQEAR